MKVHTIASITARQALLAAALALAACGGSGFRARPVDWAKESCASCRMVIADRHAAAQAELRDGRVVNFDDLGCLVIELETKRMDAVAMCFRHAREDRWVALEAASFTRVPTTPMMFGYAAVDLGEGELTFAQVRDELAAKYKMRK